MNLEIEQLIQGRLDSELHRRSLTAQLTFLLYSILILKLKFNTVNVEPALAVLLSIATSRILVYWLVLKHRIRFDFFRKYMIFTMFIHGPLWGFCIANMFWHNNFVGINSVIASFLAISFSVGAWSSLAPNLLSMIFFSLSTTIPSLVTAIYFCYSTGNHEAIPLAVILTALIPLSIRQGFLGHKDLIQSYEYLFSFQKSQQQLLEAAAENQHNARLAALGTMADGLAHEINNPLAIAVINLHSMKQRPEKDHTSRIEKILKALDRIAVIVRSLGQLSGSIDKEAKQIYRLDELIDFCTNLVAEKFKSAGVILTISKLDKVNMQCQTKQIGQVILSILNNAFDAVQGVASPQILLNAYENGESVVILISNNGPEVPEEIQQRIFEPFFSTKQGVRASGLGLSVSRSILKENGGKISLTKGPHGWVTFQIEMPKHASSSEKLAHTS